MYIISSLLITLNLVSCPIIEKIVGFGPARLMCITTQSTAQRKQRGCAIKKESTRQQYILGGKLDSHHSFLCFLFLN